MSRAQIEDQWACARTYFDNDARVKTAFGYAYTNEYAELLWAWEDHAR